MRIAARLRSSSVLVAAVVVGLVSACSGSDSTSDPGPSPGAGQGGATGGGAGTSGAGGAQAGKGGTSGGTQAGAGGKASAGGMSGAGGTAGSGGKAGASGGQGGGSGGQAGAGQAGESGAGGNAGAPAISELVIDPVQAVLKVSGQQTQMQAFQALGTVDGGAQIPVPATFAVSSTAAGQIDAATGVFTTSNQAGGVVEVTASYQGKTAKAALTVVLEATSGMPPGSNPQLFDPKTNQVVQVDPAVGPSLVYPVAETMFPQNVARVLFQWRRPTDTLFRLHFESPTLDYSVYTDGSHPTCQKAGTKVACWESDEQTWSWLAGSNPGQTVTLTLESVDPSKPGTIHQAAKVPLHFSKSPVPGAIYYWSTTAKGVRRGAMGDAAPKNFFTPGETQGKCVACHTLSRNGKRLAGDVGGENLWVVDVVNQTPPPSVFTSYNGKSIANAWTTFSPDTSRIVSAKQGLRLRDGNTGAPIGANNGLLTIKGGAGTMPDWAPDGKHLAFALVVKAADRNIKQSSIAWFSVDGDTFSNQETIVAATSAQDNYAYPMFNPTSDWIAAAHGTGSSDNDETSQIVLMPAKPGATVQELTRADTLVNDTSLPTGLTNTMPTWAPTSDDGLQWLAFASTRDYGMVLAPGSSFGDQLDQLWVAAIDTTKLGQGDPSYPAFRIPFQELTENCHRPFWAEDALNPGGMGGAGGGSGASGQGGVNQGGASGQGGAGACVKQNEDCSQGDCCQDLYCQPSADGSAYVCLPGKP